MRINTVLMLHTWSLLVLQLVAMGLLCYLFPSIEKEIEFFFAMVMMFSGFYYIAKSQENEDGQEEISGKKLLLGYWIWMGTVALLDAVLIIIAIVRA